MIDTTKVVLALCIPILLLVACGQVITPTPESPTPPLEETKTNDPTKTNTPVKPAFTSTELHSPSSTPTLKATLDRIWYATAISIQSTEDAISKQAEDDKAANIAQFPVQCDDMSFWESDISPDGKWLAASCGYSRDQTLVVQNKEGIKWVLDFRDFLKSRDWDSYGALYPKSWSPDGNYLYFGSILGFDGGGDDCFPQFLGGDYGLFRLNLKTGSWVTIIHPTDDFPGYGIEFSPTGRRYATNINGVTITDLKTGVVSNFMEPDTIEGFSWSPDGLHLAFTVAKCTDFLLDNSSAYVWDALTNQTEKLFTTQGIKLITESWMDDSKLRVRGEQLAGYNVLYTSYLYDIQQGKLIFTGTATPSP
jgi:hypothetical protein